MVTTTSKVLKPYAPFCILLALLFLLSDRSYARADLSDKDKTQIIISVLRRELARMKPLETEPLLLVIEEPLGAELPPDISKRVRVIEQQEVSDTLSAGKGITYYSVKGFWNEGRKVTILFTYSSGNLRNHAGAVSGYKFRKVSGRWKGKFTGRSSSCGASLPDR